MNELLWYVSRGTGIASIVLMTVVVALGVITAGRRRPHGDSPTVVMAVHRWLSLGMVAFLAVHVATAIAETYVSIDLISVLVPFSSSYARVWVGLGTLALDVLIAVVVTSLLRHRLSERVWKGIHWATYGLWAMAMVHGLMMGTANEPLLRATTAACGLVGAAFIVWRVSTTFADRERRRAIAGQEWS